MTRLPAPLAQAAAALFAMLLLATGSFYLRAITGADPVPFANAAPTEQAAPASVEMIMYEQVGCYYCRLWHEEIGDIYPRTEAGQAAPLRTVWKHEPLPDDLSFAAPLFLTPTFVLAVDGEEVWRFEGYNGDQFFWPVVEGALAEHAGFAPGTSE